jgi:hypothetical protein
MDKLSHPGFEELRPAAQREIAGGADWADLITKLKEVVINYPPPSGGGAPPEEPLYWAP